MKLTKLFLALLILFVSFQGVRAQEKPEAELFDSFGAVGCEEILGRLDNFLAAIRNEPGAVGYVVFHGGANPVQNSYHKRAVRGHPRTRRFDENRFKFIETNPLPSPELKVELWLGRNGGKPAAEENKTGLVLNRINERYLFSEDTFEVVRDDGRLTYMHDCPVCCAETLDLYLLSEYLKANPAMRAEISVYSNTKNRANQFINLFRRELKEEFKLPLHRLKIAYAGVDEGIAQLPGKLSTVKIWLVPGKGEKK